MRDSLLPGLGRGTADVIEEFPLSSSLDTTGMEKCLSLTTASRGCGTSAGYLAGLAIAKRRYL
jgi:hypothetical protein